MLEFCEKVKHSKITLYGHYLGNSRTSMGHAQNQAQFFHRNKKGSWAFKNFSFDHNIICFDWVMNNFLSSVIFSNQTGPFPVETAMCNQVDFQFWTFINIRHIRHFNKTQKKVFGE